jgi:gluconate 5-dehydrogenase
MGSRTEYFVHDVTNVESADSLIQRVTLQFNEPSILINNAGVHLKQEAIATSHAEFANVMRTHVDGAFALSTAAARTMIEQGTGSIVFIASMASLFGIPNVSAYSAAKTAQLGLVRSLACEWSPRGIRVNAIAPGWIETEMSRRALEGDPPRLQRVLSRTPLGRMGSSQEVARAALFLCTPAASFITGAILPVDGGASVGF